MTDWPELIRLTEADIQTIRSFDKEHSPGPQYHKDTPEELNSFFSDKSFVCYGIYQDKTMIGHISYLEKTPNVYYLNALMIHKSYRKRGIASEILNKIKQEIRKKGGKELILTVSPVNRSALAFYKKHGFKVYDSKRDVYGLGTKRFYMKHEL